MPKISVILPAYNAATFLHHAILSVLDQTFTDFELIIIDDGSTDKTAEVCQTFRDIDSRVKVIRQKNAGVSAARNAGIERSSGDYIAFIDADDTIIIDAYEKMMTAMQKTSADCAMCGYNDTDMHDNRTAHEIELPTGYLSHEQVTEYLVRPLLEDRISENLLLGTIWRYLFSRDIIVSNGIKFSGAYLEDEVFLVEYFSHETSLCVVPDGLYNYVQNPASATHKYMDGFVDIFERTLNIKSNLVRNFAIPVASDWRYNCAWAGLLIAVANEFAPNSPRGNRVGRLREICQKPIFADAIAHYEPKGMNRNKSIVANCLRKGQYMRLATMYWVKNRRR